MLPGIDVSTWQGLIGWDKVKASGTFFAGIKSSQSVGIPDARFPRNWERSHLRGVRRIAYHFMDASQPGDRQAAYDIGCVHGAGGYLPGDCAMLDIETTNGETTGEVIKEAELYVQYFLAHTRVGLYIYTGPYFWQATLGNPHSKILGKCPLWIATWGSAPGHIDNWPNGPSIWQYSATGRVYGIDGDVDVDRFLGTPHQYDLLAAYGGRK